MRRLLSSLLVCALLLPSALAALPASAAARVDAAYFGNLHWRMIGPFRAGRELAVTGVPGQPDHFYFGAVDGGVWETRNAGRTWTPIFDDQPVASIGAIAVAPSDVQTLYVGTGEADMRSDIAYGNGIYKSTDGGKSWRHAGLADSRQIARIVVDPHDANVAYAAALGHQYGPNTERGIFKTTDGGNTWTKVLYKDANTGAVDVTLDPSDARVVYAALWQTRRPPWNVYPPSNGPGSGLYKSTDGGTTWKQLANGLPSYVGRINVSISNAAPNRVYANVDSDAAHGGVYRSDDAGATWTKMDGEQRIWQRGWYFSGITADPKNPDVVYVMNTSTYRSTDGGKSFDAIIGDPSGPDFHYLWIDPNDSNRMALSSDQGTIVSVDGAKTWSSWYNQATAQFYNVITDDAFPFWVYGAQQDSGADMEPSATKYSTISQQDFCPIDVGGESGSLAPDPRHPGLVYGGVVTREIPLTGWEQNIDPTLKYPRELWRNEWTLPLAFSRADRRSLYFGHQRVFRTRDGGNTWQIVSPDLARVNEGTPANLDAPTLADDSNLSRHGIVNTLGPSPIDARMVWAGTDDGYLWVTRDDARSWHNVTPPGLTPWSKFASVDPSHFDRSVAYIAVDRHRLDDYTPYAYRTRDGGATWTPIVNGIPQGSFVNVIREDPHRRGLLYAGTEKGIYVSFDDGANWQSLQLNLPVTSIRDIAFHGSDVVIATHGRAFWVLDDAASLRQIDGALGSGGTYLFAPSPAYRVRPGNEEGTPLPLDEPQAQNPSVGVNIDYRLSNGAPVVIDVLSGGRVIRHWSSAEKPKPVDPKSVDYIPYWITQHPVPATGSGSHRFVWDFHEKDSKGALVPPGTYTIRLSTGGRSYERTAVVLRDPRAPVTNADLRAQYAFAHAIEALHDQVDAARARAKDLAKQNLPPATLRNLRTRIVGEPLPSTPDDSVGPYNHDLSSFLYVQTALDNLEAAVESADAAPTADMRASLGKIAEIYRETLAKFNAIAGSR